MALEQRVMLELMPSLSDLTVLDLASGSGRYGLIAQQGGACRVIAVDDSDSMLGANPLPERAQASMVALPFGDGTFDVVICALAIGHVAPFDSAMTEIGRVLKPGGTALISDLHPFLALGGAQRTFHAGDSVYAVEHHTYLYADMLRAADAAHMGIDALREPAPDGQTTPTVIVYRLVRR